MKRLTLLFCLISFVALGQFGPRFTGLSGGTFTNNITNTRYVRHMQPIVNPTKDAGALDSSQSWLLDILDTGTEWRMFYNGANTQLITYTPDGQDYINNDATFMAIKTKSNDVLTGWNKVLDVNGDPKPIFKPSFIPGRFDYWQVWIRTVLMDNDTLKAWFIGDDGTPTFDYRVGYATSLDNGDTWTKFGTTPIFSDCISSGSCGTRGIPVLRVIKDDTNFKMIYAGVAPNIDGLKIAESTNGKSGWTITHTGLFANQEYGFPSDFRKVGGVYYLWLQRGNMMPAGNLGPNREIVLFSSTDLTTWTNLGVQMVIRGAQEFGIGNMVKAMQKPNGNWFMANTFYINRTQAYDALNDTKEPSIGAKIADSEDGSFIKNSSCHFSYPSYVKFHMPLGYEMGLTEVISGTSGSVNSPALVQYAERDFTKLNGSQTITFANNGSIINGNNFAIKLRVSTTTNGTQELFRIGNDIVINLEGSSRKLRVRLSSDGITFQKDYITTIDITKPSGMDYIDNHIYVAMWWNGTTLRMWNADCVEEFTAGQITKTVDNALTTVNNSGDDIEISKNTAIELGRISIIEPTTSTEITELDI